jgi:HD-like signal output (HDOD) protein
MLAKASASSFGQEVEPSARTSTAPTTTPEEITQAVQAFTARRIQKRLEETIEIPPLADTAQKIIKLRVDPNATIDDITGVVETDPALAAQVVSWAASPYYASPGKIRSVEDAIVRVLGFDLVINLALGLALGKTLSLPKDHPQQATPYWQQSIYTAAVIEGLTRAMPRAERPEAGLTYLAGLLHNFGYLLLAHVFPPHFSLICRHLEVNPHLCHSYVEQHLLGISREQIGAWLMKLGHARRAVHRPALPARPGLRRRVLGLPQPGVPGRAPAALARHRLGAAGRDPGRPAGAPGADPGQGRGCGEQGARGREPAARTGFAVPRTALRLGAALRPGNFSPSSSASGTSSTPGTRSPAPDCP